MARFADLPAELVIQIIRHLFYAEGRVGPFNAGHQFLESDHTQIDASAEPKARPHERKFRWRGPRGCRPVDPHHAAWPEGLPNNPLLPLALVNRTFRQCVQELLFTSVSLPNVGAAGTFLKSLTGRSKSSNRRRRKHHENDPSRLSQHVRSIQFCWCHSGSTGKRGASLFCKILQNCPLLKNVFISNPLPLAFKEPMLEALASKPLIQEFVLHHDTRHYDTTFQWPPHEIVSQLFSHWNLLETVEFSNLSGWSRHDPLRAPAPTSIPVLNCAIRTMILRDHELDELTLSNFLKSCGESMRTLKITGPHIHLNPEAFGRVLRDATSPNLESLIILPPKHWMYWIDFVRPNLDLSPGLLDTLFDSPTALRNLKTLSFHGDLIATDHLLARLPKSLVKLCMGHCKITASLLIQALAISSEHNQRSLPNLMCLSVGSPRKCKWSTEEKIAVQSAVEMRGGCFHTSQD